LILGGTADAIEIARRLDRVADIDVVSSMAGVTRAPRRPPGRVRTGGFGGAAGLSDYLRTETIAGVIDATHPFAGQISRHAAEAGAATGVPVLHLIRPAWRRQDGDTWHGVASAGQAAAWLTASALPDGAAIFLTIGRGAVAAFADADRFRYVVRSIEPPAGIARLGDAVSVLARGPFSLEAERALMRRHEIACLVAKNSGGGASCAKIEAARTLGLPVVMIRQPEPPEGARAGDADAVVAWVRARL
jgi:precorrin-6A/cobalt-precorrin-6A reductase